MKAVNLPNSRPIPPLALDQFPMRRQPDDVTCGPTCLHAVYSYYGENLSLRKLIAEVPMLEEGGTLLSHLGKHALEKGYRTTIYSYNLRIFDPTWFNFGPNRLCDLLDKRARTRRGSKVATACSAYADYMRAGGRVRFSDLTRSVLAKHIHDGHPIICGLSSTYLYRSPREIPETGQPDDVRGDPAGHFVVLTGVDEANDQILIADPYHPNPHGPDGFYHVSTNRLIHSVLLGVMTYDANLLIIERPQ